MAKETDLLKDPLALAQQRYQEQISSFKDQFIPKPSVRKQNKINEQFGFTFNQLRGK
jgi:hypothetical protein|tara:strand:+ start:487 stop:657 length:171 start_codon:yes stop_codon:yes gene_type:complete